MKNSFILLLIGCIAVGCGDTPTDVEGTTPDLAIATGSGCYIVTTATHTSGVSPSYAGSVTGDVEGSVSSTTTSRVERGSLVLSEGQSTWDVTGGAITELVGKLVVWSYRAQTDRRADDDPYIYEMRGTSTGVTGVSRAQLRFEGTYDVRDGTPPWEIDLVSHGVICP